MLCFFSDVRAARSRRAGVSSRRYASLVFATSVFLSSAGALAQLDPDTPASAMGELLYLEDQGLIAPSRLEHAIPSSAPAALGPALAPGGLATVVVDDTLVNNPADDTDPNTTQSETAMAVNGNTICAGYNNSGPGGFSGLSRSPDLGNTWVDLGGLDTNIGETRHRGDPVIAVHHATGTFYYADIFRPGNVAGRNHIGVARSTDDCNTFNPAVLASPNSGDLAATTLSDKPWIAVDNSGGPNDGNVYACWTRFTTTGSELRVSRSTDGGLTFVNEQVIPSTGPFGCSIKVDSGGNVNLTWSNRAAGADDIRFDRSTDGGVTYTAPMLINANEDGPGTGNVVACGTQNRETLNGNIRMLNQTWLAVDNSGGPFDGNLYVVWHRDGPGGGDESDVRFSRSTDGGASWSAAVDFAPGGGATDQFEPFVEVNGQGIISIAWYDRRNDPNNLLVDVYKTFSSDGGLTFTPIERVTNTSFQVPPINPNFDTNVAQCYMGEYIAVAADASDFYYLWGDNRNTVVSAAFPAGRPDPDVFFESEAFVDEADLSIIKTDDVDPVIAGNNLTYTISVSNVGPANAQNVVVTDTIPAGEEFENFGATDPLIWDCSHLNGIVTCNLLLSLVAGLTADDIELVVQVLPETRDDLINNVNVVSSTPDPAQANNFTEEDTEVLAEADVRLVSKTDDVDPVIAGTNLEYTVTATNFGPSAAENMQIVDTLPANTTFVSATPSAGGSCVTPSVGDVGTVSCTWGGFTPAAPPNAPATHTLTLEVKVDADAPDGSVISNTATTTSDTTDPNNGNNSATEMTDVDTQAVLTVSKTDFPFDPVVAGQDFITYKIDVTNAGPSDAQNVVAVDTLPAGVTFLATVGCNEDPNLDVPPVTCTLGTLAAGDTVQFTVTVSVDAMTVGLITNTVDVSWEDTTPADNMAQATEQTLVLSMADVSVVKTDDPDPVLEGATLTYTVEVSNAGPSDAQSVDVTDVLPAQVTFVSTTGCLNDPNGVPLCNLGKIPANTSVSYTIEVVVDANAGGQIITNTATAAVGGGSTDPNLANNTDDEDTTVLAGVSFFNQPGSVLVFNVDIEEGSPANTSVIRVTNNHPTDSVDVHLVNVCRGLLSFGGLGSCAGTNREITLTHNETRVINVRNFFGLNPASCPTGYVVAYAVDDAAAQNQPVSFNFLTGSNYTRGVPGQNLPNWTKGAQAYSIQSPQPQGALIGQPGAAPQLPFDGFDLRQLATEHSTDFVANLGARRAALILMTLDVEAGAQNPSTLVALNWWNEAEDEFSGSLEYVCQVKIELSEISGLFDIGPLGSFYGSLRISPLNEHAILGFIEEIEPNRRTLRPLFTDNVPRMTTFIGR